MKRGMALCLVLLLCLVPLLGCCEPLRVVCSAFAAYDFAREMLGEQAASAQLHLMMENGIDMHSFQPDIEDIPHLRPMWPMQSKTR